jgi:hypothetical protein
MHNLMGAPSIDGRRTGKKPEAGRSNFVNGPIVAYPPSSN